MVAPKRTRAVARSAPQGAEAISAAIAADIGLGVLGNGAWLKQIDVESRYRCTRADARRALEALAIKGIVQRIPHRGHYVPMIDETPRREPVPTPVPPVNVDSSRNVC